MKPVIFAGLLAATAYSTDTILYPGTYQVSSQGGTVANCCYPDANGVTVTQPGGAGTTVNIAWTFDTTANGCAVSAAQSQAISGGAVPTTGTGDVTFTDTVTGLQQSWTLDAPTAANGDFVLDLSNVASGQGCQATLTKQLTGTATYPGVYEVSKENGTPASCCYPAGDVIVKQPGGTGTTVNVEWTFDTTATGCAIAAAAGQTISAGAVPTAGTGAVAITDTVTGLQKVWTLEAAPITSGDFLLDLTNLGSSLDCSVSLTRRTLPTVTYAGTYQVSADSGTASKCCYPAGDVTITQDSTTSQVNVQWTFDSSTTACANTNARGVSVSAGAVPDTVTKDVTFTSALGSNTETWILEYPVSVGEDFKLNLASVSTDTVGDCAVTLEMKSGYLLGLGSLVTLSLGYIMF